jgi:hypothetical protein
MTIIITRERIRMAANTFQFDPNAVAKYETEGWKAYANAQWLRMLYLIVSLAQAQFHIPFPYSMLAAYYITRASAAWFPKTGHDENKVLSYLEKFYRLARRYSGLSFDPNQVARLETKYWDAHRRLALQTDKTEFVEAMVELHAAVFNLTPEQVRESAELRVEANNVQDRVVLHKSSDPDRDWQICEDLLRRCYTSIYNQKIK